VIDPQARQRLGDATGLTGRIQFVGSDRELLNRIDVALDTTPRCGSISTCDALWMGIPVITLEGQTPASRVSSSILASAGLPDLIASDEAQYIQIARSLATHTNRLTDLRSKLRAKLSASRLCDAFAHARDLETAYRTVWMKWCQSPG
jgi:predicted O-linked N-acetylglucosamine transferase (SPINDLY family)